MWLPNVLMWAASAAAAVWKVSQLARVPQDKGLRVVTVCTLLVFVALTAQLAVTVPVPALPGWLPSQSSKLIQNEVLTFFFALLIVLLRSTLSPASEGTRGYVEIWIALVASSGLIAAYVATSPGARGASYEDAGRDPGLLAFYLVGNLYMAYATARGAYLAWATARHTQSRAAVGLRVAGIGLAMCCIGTHLPRVLSISSRLALRHDLIPGTASWTTPLLAVGIVVFFLGIGYPGVRTGVVKARLWFEVRHHYRQLRPLWMAVCTHFPNIALFPPVGPLREAVQFGHLRLRYYRRVIECRDGLVCLSPYIATPTNASRSPAHLATLVRDALHRVSYGGQPISTASVLAVPDAAGMDADARQLLALSQALATDADLRREAQAER